jgi:hypothetical protein
LSRSQFPSCYIVNPIRPAQTSHGKPSNNSGKKLNSLHVSEWDGTIPTMEYQAKQETNNMKSLFYQIKTFKLNMGGLSLRNARTI